MRYNEPEGATPKEPDCRDLGYIVRDMAKTIQVFSMELARLSGIFQKIGQNWKNRPFYLDSRF